MTQQASIGALAESPPASEARELRDARSEVVRLGAELARERALRLDAERAHADLERRVTATSAARDEFLGAAAHDLKTPIAALKLQVQGLLRRGPAHVDPELTATRLRAMNRQLVHVGDLLDRLFEIGRGDDEALDLAPEETDLVELVRDIVARYADDLAWARCPLTLTLPDAPVIGRWDRVRLDQAITNLVSNAKKYGRGAPIAITLEADADRAVLEIADRGVGIASADLEGIFERYVRSERRRTISGLGLGLWIARRFIARSGGAIEVESALGAGSTFTVVLPRTPPKRP